MSEPKFPALNLHKGALRDLAEQQGAITKKGTINKRWINKMTHDPDTHIRKMAVLAKTFEKFSHKK